MNSDALNELLKFELAAASRFRIHAAMFEARGCIVLANRSRLRSQEALQHAEALVLKLAANVDVNELPSLNLSVNVKAQLENDLELEQDSVARLTSALRGCDEPRRKLLESMLVSAEHYVDWLESQMHIISEIGFENYVAQQPRE